MALVYPQLNTGALTQFPVQKRMRTRTIVNWALDGSSVKVADAGGCITEWQLEYNGLSDSEIGTLKQFFAAMEGGLNSFTFLDPNGNLLARTEELNDPVWQSAPMLTVSANGPSPMPGRSGWHITNTGSGPQTLAQTLNAPGEYTYCFSVYAKAAQPMAVVLLAGSNRRERLVETGWTRLSFATSGNEADTAITFGMEIPGGAAIDIFGPQAEPQPAPSGYNRGITGGIYEGARFRDDAFTYTTADANRHSTTLNIFYADHL